MKLSLAQIAKKLQELTDEVQKLSSATKTTLATVRGIKGSISSKKDTAKVNALQKKIQALK